MPKRSFVAFALVATLLMMMSPASAIVYGEPDDGRHPYVGAYGIQIDGEIISICSGTLISPTVFLTAAHCTDGNQEIVDEGTDAFVTFDDEATPDADYVPGTSHQHPEFGSGGFSDAHDIAVIALDDPVAMGTYGELPTEGLLDELKPQLKSRTFTTVGYGVIRESRKKGPQGILPNDERRVALQSYSSLQKAWLKLSMNQATGDGGTCFGDSGGPHFLGGMSSNLIVSITVTGDSVCKASDVTYRVDTPVARDFLDEFVAVP